MDRALPILAHLEDDLRHAVRQRDFWSEQLPKFADDAGLRVTVSSLLEQAKATIQHLEAAIEVFKGANA